MSLGSPAAGAASITTHVKDGFSYCVHRPTPRPGGPAPRLLVVLHGSDYKHEAMCRFFAGLGDATNTLVLAPLFRSDSGPADPEGFKFLRSQHGAYDRLLLSMVEEVSAAHGITDSRFVLYGFSGGAQYAHRFFYVHPTRLHAMSIAAPGMVTLLDDTQDCWIGTRDLAARFGRAVDSAALRRVPVQLVIGAKDNVPHVGVEGQEAYDYAGRHRVERLRSLLKNYRAHGIEVEHHEVEDVEHNFERLGAAALPFLRAQLARLDAPARAAGG